MIQLLIHLIVPLAALTTFLVQPIAGKYLLPWHGGSASTWVTSMVFFQFALLLGYSLAHALQRVSARRQIFVMMGLALAGAVTLRLPLLQLGNTSGTSGVLFSLLLSLLPALCLTTSVGIMIQGWLLRRQGRVPYHLYSLSNLGSLAALCFYPFLIEPHLPLGSQSLGIQLLVWIVALGVIGLGLIFRRRSEPWLGEATRSQSSERIARSTITAWVLLSAAACVAMIGTIRILSGELGSNPISWTLPLGIYLLSFTLTFSGSWKAWCNLAMAATALVAFTLFARAHGFLALPLDLYALSILMLSLFGLCHLAHGVVYLSRPQENFGLFYLTIAVGGVVGGLFASLIAPNLWGRAWEFPAVFVLVIGWSLWSALEPRAWGRRTVFTSLALAPVAVILGTQVCQQTFGHETMRFFRNTYGQFVIISDGKVQRCISETTLHGLQAVDPTYPLHPNTYYHPAGGVGLLLRALQAERPALHVGVIGLGVGTLSAYGRPSDHFVFWDINPETFHIARDIFTYLGRSPAQVELRLRDGRLGIQESQESFDLLVLDAFSGDGIPFHLVTREAIDNALHHVPHGWLIVHASNRYIDLFPVLAGHARALGYGALRIQMTPSVQLKTREGAYPSIYILFYPEGKTQETIARLAPLAHPEAYYQLRDSGEFAETDLIHWTDERHAVLDVLKVQAPR